MKYDIYFHNDFDGRASAALMLAFLRSRGDDLEHYVPVDFDMEEQWLAENFFEKHRLFRGKRNPAIVVDFLYNPGAAFWYDHHSTSIKKAAWKKKFKRDKAHVLAPHYRSCCHAVYDALRKNYGWKPQRHLRELVRWLDVIDGARYASAGQTIAIKEPALQVDAFIERKNGDAKLAQWMIGLLAERPLGAIARLPAVAREVRAYRADIRRSLAFYKKYLRVFDGRIALIDLTRTSLKRLLYAPFYFYPKIRYAIRFTHKDGWFHISTGENPWRPSGKLHIGTLLQRYGGGGHQAVGGAEFYSRKEAERAIKEIIEALNAKG